MNPFDSKQADRVMRRWGFYAERQLAFAGIAHRAGAREICVRFIESETHAHTTCLPERISREQLIRERARADIEESLGSGWSVRFHFDRRKLSEHRLLRVVLGTAQVAKLLPSHPDLS